MLIEKQEELLFSEATQFVRQNLFFDAIKKYLSVSDEFPESELADDALYNAGLCYFHINLFDKAITTFNDVLAKYPEGDIDTVHGNEFGKTAAKCHYALINCYLGIKNFDAAKNEMNKLNSYTDSHIITAIGEKITFVELGQKALTFYLKSDN